jgi:hypothetical protein
MRRRRLHRLELLRRERVGFQSEPVHAGDVDFLALSVHQLGTTCVKQTDRGR